MKKTLSLFILAISMPIFAFSQAWVQKGLLESFTSQTEVREVIVTFQGYDAPTSNQIDIVKRLGILNGITMRALPIMGIMATKAQVEALAQHPQVRGLEANLELQYHNGNGSNIIGARELQKNPKIRDAQNRVIDGAGVTVGIIDSGVDGAHPDLMFGTKLIQNVLGQTSTPFGTLGMVPPVFVENVIATDHNSGHGTHCSGSITGTGTMSGGKYAGVAPGAKLVGYGTGAVLLVLSAVSGFDYFIVNQAKFGVQIISCSFGGSGDFNENSATSRATKKLYDMGVNVVYAAGNSGPGNNTIGPDAKAPWVLSIGAGDRFGRIATFSSRGKRFDERAFEMDGKIFVSKNKPTVVAPGVDVISARTQGPVAALGTTIDVNVLSPTELPFYTHSSGTSMATPHVAGVIALMLQANPALTPDKIKEILMETATNMPTYEEHQVGAGYVNAYAAVVRAMGVEKFGNTNHRIRNFASNIDLKLDPVAVEFAYSPLPTSSNEFTFEVEPGLIALELFATANGVAGSGNPIFIYLEAPNGQKFSGGLPATFTISRTRTSIALSPMPGTWKVKADTRIGTAAGVALPTPAPLNGLPETIRGDVTKVSAKSFSGIDDVSLNHPKRQQIESAVSKKLMDARPGGFEPAAFLTRAELADAIALGLGLRQFYDIDEVVPVSDANGLELLASSVVVNGGALRDREFVQKPIINPVNGKLLPNQIATRAEIAYAIVQALGFQAQAEAIMNMPITARDGENNFTVVDADGVGEIKGHLGLAVQMGILDVDVINGIAKLNPDAPMERADFAEVMVKAANIWLTSVAAPPIDDTPTSVASKKSKEISNISTYPNPASLESTLTFTLTQTGNVTVDIVDINGKVVATVFNNKKLNAGEHEISAFVSDLKPGIYTYRVSTISGMQSTRLIVQ